MIYQLFLEQVSEIPQAIGIVTSDGQEYTYARAQEIVIQWANYLYKQGITSGDRVGVLLDNEYLHVFIFLALDRINATYVPFDLSIPDLQLLDDIEALSLKAFITDPIMRKRFNLNPCTMGCRETKLLSLDGEIEKIIADEDYHSCLVIYDSNKDKIIYLVSSSGTTQEKKWIPIAGGGITYWGELERHRYGKEPIKKFLATRSPAYDARIFEYTSAFGAGATLYLLTSDERKDFDCIVKVLKNSAITNLLLIASQLMPDNTNTLVSDFSHFGLKHLLVTGDACSPNLKIACEKYEIQLWNCYGPTEATFGISIFCVNHQPLLETEDGKQIVPIGKPIGSDVSCHIIEGILYIQSLFLTPGYHLKVPDDTSFVSKDIDGTCIRLFDTGDKFCFQNELLYYQGRAKFDGHCKVNGVKVSPTLVIGRLEKYASKYPTECFQFAVVVKPYPFGDHSRFKLFAYLSFSDNFDREKLIAYLKGYLTPEAFPMLLRLSRLPSFPVSEKIIVKELIERIDQPEEFFYSMVEYGLTIDDYDADDVATIKKITEIWQQILSIKETIPLDADFMLYGGDSMLAKIMANKIQDSLDNRYRYSSLYYLEKITIRTIYHSLKEANHYTDIASIICLRKATTSNCTNIFFLPALLGEGYFSYRKLSEEWFDNHDQNIYGLTDPGIFDQKYLPTDLSSAIKRYVAAIKTKQAHGPYKLLGFSFGATLAYYVADQLVSEGEKVDELHLIDGYPPLLYQLISDEAYAKTLQSLLNFTLQILKNGFYKETLNPINLSNFRQYTKTHQIESAFKLFHRNVTKYESRCLLWMAERHLQFILQAPQVQNKSNVFPIFYLTNTEQVYSKIIDLIPDLPKESVFYNYYGWNEYFNTMRRSGIQIDCDHIGVISQVGYAREYWQCAHDFVKNIKCDLFTPKAFYWLLNSGDSSYKLRIFFLSSFNLDSLLQVFTTNGINPHVQFFDKSSMIKNQESNMIYSSLANIYCEGPKEKMDKITAVLDSHQIRCRAKGDERMFLPKLNKLPRVTERIHIHLTISKNGRNPKVITKIWEPYILSLISDLERLGIQTRLPEVSPEIKTSTNGINFLGISLICETDMLYILKKLHTYVGIMPTSRTVNSLAYEHNITWFSGTYCEMLESISEFLASFMSLLNESCLSAISVNAHEYKGLRFFSAESSLKAIEKTQLKHQDPELKPQYQFINNDSLILVNASQEYREEIEHLFSKLDPQPHEPAKHYELLKNPNIFFSQVSLCAAKSYKFPNHFENYVHNQDYNGYRNYADLSLATGLSVEYLKECHQKNIENYNKICLLREYLTNSLYKFPHSLSLDEVLATTDEEAQNLYIAYSGITQEKIKFEKAKKLTLIERKILYVHRFNISSQGYNELKDYQSFIRSEQRSKGCLM